MLDLLATGTAPSPSKINPNPATPQSAGAGGKRIPSSLMKMRRESLASTGKYNLQLPTVQASTLPDNSLAGMATKFRTASTASLPAFCTPKRHTPKTLKVCLDTATGMLAKPELDLATAPKRSSDMSGASSQHTATSSSSRKSFTPGLRRAHTLDLGEDRLDSKDMDNLLRSGLATPRRSRRSFRVPASGTSGEIMSGSTSHSAKRFSKLKNKPDATAMGGSSSHTSGSGNGGRRNLRRSKSIDESATPRRNSGSKSRTPRRSHTFSERSEREEDTSTSFSDVSDRTPTPVEPSLWKCMCGEENTPDCKFCGMCGSKVRWECADCGYANKCKFKFCGMCGIVKKVQGEN